MALHKTTKGEKNAPAVKEERRQRREEASAKAQSARFVASRAVLIALLAAVCAVPVIFVASPISYIPLVAVFFMVVISYVYLRALVGSLEYSEESLLRSCERGVATYFEVSFKNNSALPLIRLDFNLYVSDLFGGIDVETPSSLVLMPKEEHRYRFEATFDHIGTYSAGISKIVVGDILGLFQHTIVNGNRHEIEVLPRLFDLSDLDLENVSVQDSSKAYQPIVTDDMDYAGVRGYEPGDPLKTIHWKLSSRSVDSSYFTRLFEAFGNPSISIIIDHSSPSYDTESLMCVFDGLVESALSIGKKAKELGLDARITYCDKAGEIQQMFAVTTEESAALIAAIPRIKVGSGEGAKRALRNVCQSTHGDGNVAYCTAHVDEEVINQLQDIKLHQRNPILVLVVPRSLEGKELEEFVRPVRRLNASQISYYIVSNAAEVGEAM